MLMENVSKKSDNQPGQTTIWTGALPCSVSDVIWSCSLPSGAQVVESTDRFLKLLIQHIIKTKLIREINT